MSNKTQDMYLKAKALMPGGTQLLSKRPEMFAPDHWPAYFSRAKGCETWDMDDVHYYDMSLGGIGSTFLGYADEDVSAAVTKRIQNGSMCTLNPPEEVELAERLCAIHPWASCARFARTGGEIGAVAVRIARATTGRQTVAICGYHGWPDWYLAANLGEDDTLRGHLLPGLEPAGVPASLRGTTVAFSENSREEFDAIIDRHGDDLACVVMEPMRSRMPAPGFLEYVKQKANACGALLIFDEITIGWRLCFGGAHLKTGVTPDMAIFAKALGNGHPIGAVIGTKAAMEGAHSSFISSTYWTESVGPVAALATLDKIERTKTWEHAEKIGTRMKKHWNTLIEKHGVPAKGDDGFPCLAHFAFTEQPLPLKTLYTRLMLEKGYLAGPAIYCMLAHTEDIIDGYAKAVDEVFARMADIIKKGDVMEAIDGKVCHSGFRRLTT